MHSTHRIRVSTLVVAVVALVAGAARAENTVETCTQGCHEDVKNEHPKHQQLKCLECHPNVTDGKVDHADALDATPTEVMCATAGCHPDQTAKTRAGSHKDAPCETCHGDVHDAFKLNDEKACKQCHGDEVKAHQSGVHAKAKKPVTKPCATVA